MADTLRLVKTLFNATDGKHHKYLVAYLKLKGNSYPGGHWKNPYHNAIPALCLPSPKGQGIAGVEITSINVGSLHSTNGVSLQNLQQ